MIPEHPSNNMSVYMEPLIDDLVCAWEEGVWHTTGLQRQTSEHMFGTTTPCMTYRRTGYSTTGVSTGSSLA